MTTTTASCLCGNLKISFTGKPETRILCHCLDCRKISGSNYSDNAVIVDENFKLVAGTPKTYTKIADSGRSITSYFCPDCGSTVYREGEWIPGKKILKTGSVDDPKWQNETEIKGEVWTESKLTWLPELKNAKA